MMRSSCTGMKEDHYTAVIRSRIIRRRRVWSPLRWLADARDHEFLILLGSTPHRPYRYEPRVRKRRPKQYPLMQTPRKALRKLLANNTDVD